MRLGSIIATWVPRAVRAVVGLVLSLPLSLASSPNDPPAFEDLRTLAVQSGLLGDDLSPALVPLTAEDPANVWRFRPSGPFDQLLSDSPSVRVHVPIGHLSNHMTGDPQAPLASEVLRTAVRTLAFCKENSLGEPLALSEGALDIFLVPLHGIATGYAVLQPRPAHAPGASGFAVLDLSLSPQVAAETTATLVARLVFAAHHGNAPLYWTEPSIAYVAEQVVGRGDRTTNARLARWNHPEPGFLIHDPLLARGNVSLFDPLRPAVALRTLGLTWRNLARQTDTTLSPQAVIDEAIQASTGLDILDLWSLAGEAQIARGIVPTRWAARVETIPQLDRPSELPLAASGIGLIRILPDPSHSEGTRVSLEIPEPQWRVSLLAHRRGVNAWDKAALPSDSPLSFLIPWADYDQAVVLLVRPQATASDGSFRWGAQTADRSGLFALSAFGARALPGGFIEVNWSSAWEEDLFGWLVERSLRQDGPWDLVGGQPIPALGLPQTGSEYQIQDRPPKAATRVYYRVSAITTSGLRITGPVVAVTCLP